MRHEEHMDHWPPRFPWRDSLTTMGRGVLLDRTQHWISVQCQSEEALARLWWSLLVEPGDSQAGALIRRYGTIGALDAVWAATAETEQIPMAAIRRWGPRMQSDLLRRTLNMAAAQHIRFVGPDAPEYSPGLRDLGDHAPIGLWVRGGANIEWPATVAIVGVRAATSYGVQVATDLAFAVSDRLTVVSGGAYGIDRAAHRGALAAEHPTVAFLAGGLDRLYPAGNQALFEQVTRRGLLLSETVPGTTPTKWRFLARNRLIASATAATLVIEAGARSGALNTAHHALQIGRPVGAVPGPITSASSAGTNRLLREGLAELVRSAEDLCELCGMSRKDGASGSVSENEVLTAEHLRVADALSARVSRSLAEITTSSGVETARVQSLLSELQVLGYVLARSTGWVVSEQWMRRRSGASSQ
ncbi:MAG: DNA-processing protein DprA [Microbacteriaceae bacterium]|nr:DNA-processing protein DprA [Microbacteriaceae bacterium]MCI1207158.1 DNA-processing protein DprA [Microbacteriaceae bacterium]